MCQIRASSGGGTGGAAGNRGARQRITAGRRLPWSARKLRSPLAVWDSVTSSLLRARRAMSHHGRVRHKYTPLGDHLQADGRPSVTMTDAMLSPLVGGLPAAAWRYREWWANETAENTSHVQCRDGWRAAGYRVAAVDLAAKTVTFTRV